MKKTVMILTTAAMVLGSVLPTAAFAQTSAPAVVSTHINRLLLPNATITAINGATLTVSLNSIPYTVNTTSTTVFVRRFFGRTTIAQLSVGDIVDVRGTWTDATHTAVNATYVRDTSIQERHDTFSGSVTSVSSSGFTLQSLARGTVTVNVPSTAVLVDRNGNKILLSSIGVFDTVTVDGMWDRSLTTVTATWVKDYSLPR